MMSNIEKFLAALGNTLMDVSGITASDGPDAIADALVNAGGADSSVVGSAAGLTGAQTAAVMHALADGETTREFALISVRRGSADISLLDPGARWYISNVIGIQ